MLLLDHMKESYTTPGVKYLAASLGLIDNDSLFDMDALLDGKTIDPNEKNALLERAAEILLTPEAVLSRLSTLSDEEMSLFERACQGPVKLKGEEREAGFNVKGCRYAFLVSSKDDDTPFPSLESVPEEKRIYVEMAKAAKKLASDTLEVPEDVVPLYHSVNTPEFQAKRRHGFQLTRCLDVCDILYQTTPVSVVCRMMEQELGERITEEDVLSLLRFLPKDSTFCVYDSDTGRIARRRHVKNGRKLIQKQDGRDFYLPSSEEIKVLYKKQWLGTPAYIRYRDFLEKIAKLSPIDADEGAYQLWQGISGEEPHQENLQTMIEWSSADYTLSKLLMTLYDACVQETRFPAYCGHTIAEVRADHPDFKPDYFPDGLSELQFETSPDTVRVRRNDPCPCGSGKKFKKCCMC